MNSLLLTLLEHFEADCYLPSAGIYNLPKFSRWTRGEISGALRSASDPSQIIHDDDGNVVADYRLIAKDPDTRRRAATYTLTHHGERRRAEMRAEIEELRIAS